MIRRVLVAIGLPAALLFASRPTLAAEQPAPRAIGFTIDLLPIVLSATAGEVGASGQVWLGYGHFRFRLVGAHIAFPNWLAGGDGFEDQRTNVGALLCDYVFGDHFNGAWLGTGLEYWHSTIGLEGTELRTSWGTVVWTLGGGYIFPIVGNFYVEPWGAGHVALSRPTPSIGDKTYHPPRLNAEVSLKIGIFFDF
jgi:hypothetical protein